MRIKEARKSIIRNLIKGGVWVAVFALATFFCNSLAKSCEWQFLAEIFRYLRYATLLACAGFAAWTGMTVYELWKISKEVEAGDSNAASKPDDGGDSNAASKPDDGGDSNAASKPARPTRKSLREACDEADDELVESEIRFREAEEKADEASAKLSEYEELLKAAKARRNKKP